MKGGNRQRSFGSAGGMIKSMIGFSCVGSLTGAGVVLVDGGREAEAAGEEARGGVDAHDLRWEGGDRSLGSVIG